MPQQIIIAEQLRIAALLTDERIDELIVAQGRYQIGDVFLGTVENVLPGIDAAFVNIGESEKNGFIHVSDLGPLRLKKGSTGITELLEPRQKVLVQVMKEPTGNKGPRLTGNLGLPGRYLVLQPYGQGVNISRKISSESERNRLRALGVLVKPPSTGLMMRSEADGISEELLIDDLESLLKHWELIQQASENCSPPLLLNRDEDFIHRILRDHISPELTRIVVENVEAVERVKKFIGKEEVNIKIDCHQEPTDLLEHFRVNTAIHNALQPRVDLPSGGYIIIEPTEALTVIDVNSGSFTRSANSRETVLWTNCEAAIEIARQLKLRNIGGVIIIDFIDLDTRRDQLQLLEHFTEAISNDSARPQIAQLTELGLVELTRKRQGQNIYELFGKKCSNCAGQGHLTVIPVKDQIKPDASARGLITSNNLSKTEPSLAIENNNLSKKKKTTRNKEQENKVLTDDLLSSNIKDSSETISDESNSEQLTNKQEPELIAVRMNQAQEDVFSFMGLNPILLLDKLPADDNFIVQVIRPGQDEDTIMEAARHEIAANSTKRRRKGKNINRLNTKNNNDQQVNISIEDGKKSLDLNDNQIEVNEEVNAQENIINETQPEQTLKENIDVSEKLIVNELESPELEEAIEDPRRRRRRSSSVN